MHVVNVSYVLWHFVHFIDIVSFSEQIDICPELKVQNNLWFQTRCCVLYMYIFILQTLSHYKLYARVSKRVKLSWMQFDIEKSIDELEKLNILLVFCCIDKISVRINWIVQKVRMLKLANGRKWEKEIEKKRLRCRSMINFSDYDSMRVQRK